MIEIKRFDNFFDFKSFNESFIETNKLLYYHLANSINRTIEGNGEDPELYNFFNLVEGNKFLSVLHILNECLIYSNCDDDEFVNVLSLELNFELFKRHMFFGTKGIIDKLFEKQYPFHQPHHLLPIAMRHLCVYENRSNKSAPNDADSYRSLQSKWPKSRTVLPNT